MVYFVKINDDGIGAKPPKHIHRHTYIQKRQSVKSFVCCYGWKIMRKFYSGPILVYYKFILTFFSSIRHWVSVNFPRIFFGILSFRNFHLLPFYVFYIQHSSLSSLVFAFQFWGSCGVIAWLTSIYHILGL